MVMMQTTFKQKVKGEKNGLLTIGSQMHILTLKVKMSSFVKSLNGAKPFLKLNSEVTLMF
jgi:hypothetical protein